MKQTFEVLNVKCGGCANTLIKSLKEEFGDAAEPLYPRIIKYFQIVESYHFIKFANKPSK